jgi:hypothetical protein
MEVAGHAELVPGVRKTNDELVRRPEALVGLQERDELAQDLGDVAPVDLVDHEDMGLARRLLPRPQKALQLVRSQRLGTEPVQRHGDQPPLEDPLARQAGIEPREPLHRPDLSGHAGLCGVLRHGGVSRHLGDRPHARYPIRHDDEIASLHLVPERVDGGHRVGIVGDIGSASRGALTDGLPGCGARVVDGATVAQRDPALRDALFVQGVVAGPPAVGERHLPDPGGADIDTARLGGPDRPARGGAAQPLERTLAHLILDLTGPVRVPRGQHRSNPLDELLIAVRLVERHQLDTPVRLEAPEPRLDLPATRRYGPVAEANRFLDDAVGLPRAGRTVVDDVLRVMDRPFRLSHPALLGLRNFRRQTDELRVLEGPTTEGPLAVRGLQLAANRALARRIGFEHRSHDVLELLPCPLPLEATPLTLRFSQPLERRVALDRHASKSRPLVGRKLRPTGIRDEELALACCVVRRRVPC